MPKEKAPFFQGLVIFGIKKVDTFYQLVDKMYQLYHSYSLYFLTFRDMVLWVKPNALAVLL